MRKIIILILFAGLTSKTEAQTTSDIQKELEKAQARLKVLQADTSIAKKLKKAQQLSNSVSNDPKIQAKLKEAKAQLASQKNTHPNELANVSIPDSLNSKIFSMDSMAAAMNGSVAQLQNYNQQTDQAIPKQNFTNHADKLPQLTKNTLVEMAQIELNKIKPYLTFNEKDTIDLIIKNKNSNLAGIGVFLLSSGGSKNAAGYLICSGVIKRPDNKWSVNDLGVLFRDQQLYEQCLQCYFYASKLDSGKSVSINTNIGWASAYYGDFPTAQKYFDKALTVDNDFSSALEGEALLAYAQGNTEALFQCLAKEIKYFGEGGGSMNEPSDEFSSTCGGVSNQNSETNTDKQSDPTNDHTFDDNGDDGSDQDAAPTADVEPVSYPSYRPVFVNDTKDLITAGGAASKLIQQAYDKQKGYQTVLTQKLASLKPLVQTPYTDDEGNVIYPNKFKKYVDLIAQVRIQFEKRTAWYYQKYIKEINKFLPTLLPHDNDMVKQYTEALGKCSNEKDEQKCRDNVNCVWLPKMHTSKNSDLEAADRIWSTYSDNVRQTIQWYLNATAPFISRVHAEGWNDYLNNQREVDVRMAILKTYACWCSDVIYLSRSPLCGIIQQTVPSCPIDINGMDAPDPTSQKPKHIKEFEGKCYEMSFDMGIGGIEENCHTTKFFIGKGPFKAFYEHVDDPLYGKDNNYAGKAGITVGVSKWIGLGADEYYADGEKNEGAESPAKVGVNAKLEGTAWLKFDGNGNITGGGSEVAASVEAGASIEKSDIKTDATANLGINVNTEWEVVDGQTQVVGKPAQIKVIK